MDMKMDNKMDMLSINNHHYIVMFIIMVISGFLTTMNMWIDKVGDFQISLNDIYMILLMSGWMFLFMGIFYSKMNISIIGLGLVIINIWCIRTQFMITQSQYLLGMIPHHSMAIHMSKKLLNKSGSGADNIMLSYLQNLIRTQDNEINFMKDKLH